MKFWKLASACAAIILSTSSQAMTVWVVESGQDPLSNSQDVLALSAGTTTLDLYYDVEGNTSYGYDFILDITGTGSISGVGGGDSDPFGGGIYGSGWRQTGGDFLGETGSSVLGFSFNFTAGSDTSLLVSGTYTDENFLDAPIVSSTLATTSVSTVPVPAAVWLFGSGFIGLIGIARRKKL
jgi:hypothetical protein